MAAEFEAHRRKQLIGEIALASRCEAFIKGCAQNWHRSALFDCREYSPAPFTGIGYAARELRELRIFYHRAGGQIQEPGGNHTSTPPYLGHVCKVEIVLIVF